jgi:hypothetical protein
VGRGVRMYAVHDGGAGPTHHVSSACDGSKLFFLYSEASIGRARATKPDGADCSTATAPN